MNHYEEKQEARRARLESAADRLENRASETIDQVRRVGECMAGTPVLVGHHSERRHRRDLERMDRRLSQACEDTRTAEELRRRADAVGTGGISSDDPEAIDKLRAKAAELEGQRERMKALNAVWRKHGKPAPDDTERWTKIATELGVELQAFKAVRLDLARFPWLDQPAPKYALTNIGAQIRSTRERIKQIETEAARRETVGEQPAREIGDWQLVEDHADNRVCLSSPSKPSQEVRELLKSRGFRWSPTRSAWVRTLSAASVSVAVDILEQIAKA